MRLTTSKKVSVWPSSKMNHLGIIIALAFVNSVSWASRYSFHFNYGHLELSLTATEYGFISGIGYTAVYVVCLIPWGRASDLPWIGNRSVILTGLLIQMIFTSLQGYAWDFSSLLIVRFGIAAGQAAIVSPCVAIIGRLYSLGELSTANAIFTVGYFSGSGFVASLSEPLSNWYGPRVTFIVYGLLCGFGAIIFFISVPDDAQQASDCSGKRAEADSALDALGLWLTRPPLALVLLAGCSKMVAEFMFLSLVPSYVITYWADDADSRSRVAVAFGTLTLVTSIVSTTAGGLLSDFLVVRGVPTAPALVPAVAALASCPFVLLTFLVEAGLAAHFAALFAWCLVIDVWPGPTNSLIQASPPPQLLARGRAPPSTPSSRFSGPSRVHFKPAPHPRRGEPFVEPLQSCDRPPAAVRPETESTVTPKRPVQRFTNVVAICADSRVIKSISLTLSKL